MLVKMKNLKENTCIVNEDKDLATEAQKKYLRQLGYTDDMSDLSKREATQLIVKLARKSQ